MIPNNLVGLVLFAASLGPGYVYVRVAERRDPRADRSALVEAVEMVSIGAMASLVGALVVLAVGDLTDLLKAQQIARDPTAYLVAEPVRGLSALLLLFALAYLLAWAAARAVHRRRAAAHVPGTTGWWEMFHRLRPSEDHLTFVIVELRDSRKVGGVLRSFTSQHDDNRELVLGRPIGVATTKNPKFVRTDDEFLIVREQDVLYVSGQYREGKSASKKRRFWQWK